MLQSAIVAGEGGGVRFKNVDRICCVESQTTSTQNKKPPEAADKCS